MNAPVIEVDGIGKRYPMRYKPPGDKNNSMQRATSFEEEADAEAVGLKILAINLFAAVGY